MSENEVKVLYGLRLKNQDKLLGYKTRNTQADYSNGTVYELSNTANNEWLTVSFEEAKRTKYDPTPWYNSTIEKPTHDFKHNQLEIIKVERIETITVCEEPKYFNIRFNNSQENREASVLVNGEYYTVNELGVRDSDQDEDFTLLPKIVISNGINLLVEDYNDVVYRLIEISHGSSYYDRKIFLDKRYFKKAK